MNSFMGRWWVGGAWQYVCLMEKDDGVLAFENNWKLIVRIGIVVLWKVWASLDAVAFRYAPSSRLESRGVVGRS
jgi:hypothetical protein